MTLTMNIASLLPRAVALGFLLLTLPLSGAATKSSAPATPPPAAPAAWAWTDLVNRPDRWPPQVTLQRTVAFQDGTRFEQGAILRVTKVTARNVEVILPDGITTDLGVADTDLLAAANRYWSNLNADQRAVDFNAIARDPSLHPAMVTAHVALHFPSGVLPAGSEVPLADIVNNRIHVWSTADKRPMALNPGDTDLLYRARDRARLPAAERPNRIAALLQGATLDAAGQPVELPPKAVYVLYRASTTCSNSQHYSPMFAERMQALLAAHPDVALVSLAYDPADADALSFARKFGLPGVVVPASKRPPQLEKYNAQVMPAIIVIDRHGKELLSNRRYTGAAGHDATLVRLESELKRMAL